LQCAILSPLFKVRDYAITDIYTFPVKVSWRTSGSNSMDDEDFVDVFQKNNVLPSPKQITISRDRPFEVSVMYSSPELLPVGAPLLLGTYKIPSVPNKEGDAKIRLKVKLDIHGIINLESAQLIDTVDAPAEKTEDKPVKEGEQPATTTATTEEPKSPTTEEKKPEEKKEQTAEEKKEAEKLKKKVLRTDLIVNPHTSSLSQQEVSSLTEDEVKMLATDRLCLETADRKNAVESYVYKVRGQLNEVLAPYSSETERNALSKLLEDTENWLYDEGADLTKSAYIKKLEELKALGDPITRRQYEYENRYEILNSTRSAIEQYKLAATSMDPKYDHIEQEERNKVVKECERVEKEINELMSKQDKLNKHTDPVVTVADLTKKKTELEKFSNAILNKPKPKPKPEEKKPEEKKPEEKKPEEGTTTKKPEEESMKPEETPTPTPTSTSTEETKEKNKMDLD